MEEDFIGMPEILRGELMNAVKSCLTMFYLCAMFGTLIGSLPL